MPAKQGLFSEAYLPGATAVGLTFKDGVVLAAEKRVSYGSHIVSRSVKKVFKVTDHVGAACAGMVADMQVLVREITSYARIRELELKRAITPNSVAKLMSVLMFERRFTPLLTQVIVGGVEGKPAIFVLDPVGSVIPDQYTAVGTGAEVAIGVLEAGYASDMTEKGARDLALKTIKSAIQRDAASGDGVDILVITENESKEESIAF